MFACYLLFFVWKTDVWCSALDFVVGLKGFVFESFNLWIIKRVVYLNMLNIIKNINKKEK